eukprot:gene5858-4181_t
MIVEGLKLLKSEDSPEWGKNYSFLSSSDASLITRLYVSGFRFGFEGVFEFETFDALVGFIQQRKYFPTAGNKDHNANRQIRFQDAFCLVGWSLLLLLLEKRNANFTLEQERIPTEKKTKDAQKGAPQRKAKNNNNNNNNMFVFCCLVQEEERDSAAVCGGGGVSILGFVPLVVMKMHSGRTGKQKGKKAEMRNTLAVVLNRAVVVGPEIAKFYIYIYIYIYISRCGAESTTLYTNTKRDGCALTPGIRTEEGGDRTQNQVDVGTGEKGPRRPTNNGALGLFRVIRREKEKNVFATVSCCLFPPPCVVGMKIMEGSAGYQLPAINVGMKIMEGSAGYQLPAINVGMKIMEGSAGYQCGYENNGGKCRLSMWVWVWVASIEQPLILSLNSLSLSLVCLSVSRSPLRCRGPSVQEVQGAGHSGSTPFAVKIRLHRRAEKLVRDGASAFLKREKALRRSVQTGSVQRLSSSYPRRPLPLSLCREKEKKEIFLVLLFKTVCCCELSIYVVWCSLPLHCILFHSLLTRCVWAKGGTSPRNLFVYIYYKARREVLLVALAIISIIYIYVCMLFVYHIMEGKIRYGSLAHTRAQHRITGLRGTREDHSEGGGQRPSVSWTILPSLETTHTHRPQPPGK